MADSQAQLAANLGQTELTADTTRELVFDFSMSWNGLPTPVSCVDPYGVRPSLTHQLAAMTPEMSE